MHEKDEATRRGAGAPRSPAADGAHRERERERAYIYIYIYREREREREREMNLYYTFIIYSAIYSVFIHVSSC